MARHALGRAHLELHRAVLVLDLVDDRLYLSLLRGAADDEAFTA